MSIRKRFIIFSILWGIVPAFISAVICIANFNIQNTEIIKQNIITVAKDQSKNLEDFFEENVKNLGDISNIPMTSQVLIDSNDKIDSKDKEHNIDIMNQILSGKTNEQFYLKGLLLINYNGNTIASSNKEYIENNTVLSSSELEKLWENQIVVTDVIEREDINNGNKSVVIASPIFFKNEYQGSMLGVIDISYFQHLVDNTSFFKSGKVVIMDSNGKVVSGNSNDLKYSINSINSPNNLYEQWKKIDINSNPTGTIDYNMNGIDKIAYYSKITNTDWTVLSGVEWAEFKAPINKSIKTIIAFLIFVLLLITASYAFIINHFSKPVDKLLDAIRKIKQGNYKDRFIYDKSNEFGEVAEAFNDLIDTIEKNKQYIEERNRDLQSLTSNIPGGVHRSRIENGENILDFISVGCLNVLGYGEDECNKIIGKRALDFVYEKDRERVNNEIKEQLKKSNKFNLEYRIKRQDESLIWLLDSGQMVKDKDGKEFIYSVVINITESKISQEELRLSEERYRIIMTQTEDIIFEWDVIEDTISYSGNWKNKFNYEPITKNITKEIYKTKNIYEDDMKKLSELLNAVIRGAKYKETEIRIGAGKGDYIWCKIRITAMFNENGDVCKVIGVIIDINKEKIEAEKLLFKAQRDSLTELYNKGTVESIIEECIECSSGTGNYALFIIDIDDFKAINDNLGHSFGDSVLSNVSSMFLNTFGEDAIIGRIGGDEFIVFLKNVDSDEFIHEKANDLVEGFSRSFTGENLEYKVSGSIGITKYPENGQTFDELFLKADKALYLAKNKGKDNYCLYSEKLN